MSMMGHGAPPPGPGGHPPMASITVAFGHASDMARSKLDAMDSGKQDKASVNYRPCDNPKECCEVCVHWEGARGDTQATCMKVAGTVRAMDTCDLFEAPGGPEAPNEPPDSPQEMAAEGEGPGQVPVGTAPSSGSRGLPWQK